MGKNSNQVSLHAGMGKNKSKSRTNIPQGVGKKKKRNKKKKQANKKIQNLFDRLRNESSSNTELSCSNTVLILEKKPQEIERRNSTIIIADDDDISIHNESCIHTPRSDINACPIQCSTPLHKQGLDISTNVVNLTREINNDSYLTIDLTNDTTYNSKQDTVIDLASPSVDSLDCSLSMSGDSNVTVINTKRKNNLRQMRKLVNGIKEMDSSDKGNLLQFITQQIFSGCNGPIIGGSIHSLKNGIHRATETVEDTYIKEVILGQVRSRDSIGSNIYNPQRDVNNRTGLRMVVIDGSNVAMQHSKGRVFSVEGLKICIDFFLSRGHAVKAFVPRFRCKAGKSTNGKLLDQLERQGLVVYTPSREIRGHIVSSYDDRYIVQCAAEFDAVIVSGDNYRDLLTENPRWRHVIENRLLQFTWVGDMIMFPKDPLGRYGPTLQEFLRHPGQNNNHNVQ